MTNAERFENILVTVLQIPPAEITDGLSSDDVDTWDSLNHIALMGALEQEFNISIDVTRLEETHSIGSLKSLLAEQGVSFNISPNE